MLTIVFMLLALIVSLATGYLLYCFWSIPTTGIFTKIVYAVIIVTPLVIVMWHMVITGFSYLSNIPLNPKNALAVLGCTILVIIAMMWSSYLKNLKKEGRIWYPPPRSKPRLVQLFFIVIAGYFLIGFYHSWLIQIWVGVWMVIAGLYDPKKYAQSLLFGKNEVVIPFSLTFGAVKNHWLLALCISILLHSLVISSGRNDLLAITGLTACMLLWWLVHDGFFRTHYTAYTASLTKPIPINSNN